VSSFKQGVTEETLSEIQDRVTAAGKDNAFKLGEFSSRLERLQEQVSVAWRHVHPSSADSDQNHTCSAGGSVDQYMSSTTLPVLGSRHERDRAENECDTRECNDEVSVA
jgi:hypothetical protein